MYGAIKHYPITPKIGSHIPIPIPSLPTRIQQMKTTSVRQKQNKKKPAISLRKDPVRGYYICLPPLTGYGRPKTTYHNANGHGVQPDSKLYTQYYYQLH